jgi:hypothetical protein
VCNEVPPDYRKIFKHFRRAPGMLNGFHEWLVGRIGYESSLAWPTLALWFVEPVGDESYSDLPPSWNRLPSRRSFA